MPSQAPADLLFGPTSLLMNVLQNTGNKGLKQTVMAAPVSYIASIWVKADRACTWTASCVPTTGTTVTTTTSVPANTWTLVKASYNHAQTTAQETAVSFYTNAIGVFRLACAQFCRVVGSYDPAVHIIPNEWTRGGLSDDATMTTTVERWNPDDETWEKVVAESYVDSAGVTHYSDAGNALSGGAFTETIPDLYFPLDQTLYYRARVNHVSAGVVSPDSGSAAIDGVSDRRWLLIPAFEGRTGQSTSGDILQVWRNEETHESDSDTQTAVFHALGRKTAIVVSDTVSGAESGTMELGFLADDAYDCFERIREAQCPVLLRAGAYGFQKWIRFIGKRRASIPLGFNVQPRVKAQWVECDPPQGVN